MNVGQAPPMLLKAESFRSDDIGVFEWDRKRTADTLTISNEGRTIEWEPQESYDNAMNAPPIWISTSTLMHLHSGKFRWEFVVDEMAARQIGVGFMLLWQDAAGMRGPIWDFYGYLGAGSSDWAYDPSTGDVVTRTKSIEGKLPKFADKHTGVVTVSLNLPRQRDGNGVFIIEGKESSPIGLPPGAVVLPAATLLAETQRITLANFSRLE